MMSSVSILNNPSRTRFGATPNGQDIKGFRDDLKAAGQANQDLLLKAPQEDDPPTRYSVGMDKLKKGGLVLAGITAALGGTYGGYQSFQSYRAHLPTAETVMFDKALSPDWKMLASTAEAARETNGVSDPSLQGKFNQQFVNLLNKTVLTLKENPGSQLDQTLVQKLERARDFMPAKKAYPLAVDFTQFMEKELKTLGTTPAQATSAQLNQVDVLNGFVNVTPELDHLSGSEKMELTKALQGDYKANQAFPNPGLFHETMTSAMGTGIQGISLKTFVNVKSKEDAQQMLKTAVLSGSNFQDLTQGQKDALVGRMNEALGSIDHYQPSVFWAMGAVTLLLASVAGGAGLTAKEGKRVLTALGAHNDIINGLKNPTLICNYADLSNPDAERQMKMMISNIRYQSSEMARVFKDVYTSSGDFRKLVEKDYPTEESLPTAEYFFKRFVYETKKSMLEKQTHGDELGFVQLMSEKMQTAFEMDKVISVALPQGMTVPEKPNYDKANANPLEVLQQERRHIEHGMRTAMGQLANLTVSRYRDQEMVQKLGAELQQGLSALEQRKPQLSTAQYGEQQQPLMQKGQELQRAQERLQNTEKTLSMAKYALGKAIVKMQDMQHQLSVAIDRAVQGQQSDAVAKLNNDLKQSLSNPDLQKWSDEVQLENMKAQIRQEMVQEEAEMQAKVEAALKAVDLLPSAHSTQNSQTLSQRRES